ncbi:hypothetical protein FOA52_001848 [Chlamydomonas sp. UWO 241]|nr:hypothetical protein FOA52_001848 [Chlamydomonas sp. UWO 241]
MATLYPSMATRPSVVTAAVATGGKAEDEPHCSKYKGVTWSKGRWRVDLWNSETKRKQYIGSYPSEEDAARAYDCAAVKLRGPGSECNFLGDVLSDPPASLGVERRERQSSRFIGVSWHNASSAWMADLWNPETLHKQHIGSYRSEEDAARAYDCAAVKLHGPDTKLNFPGDVVDEPPASLGDQRREGKKSRFIGVGWNKLKSKWVSTVRDPRPQAKRQKHLGYFASEEDAARAYDCAAAELRGPNAKLNFPDELISEPPASLGEQRTEQKTSLFVGVTWVERGRKWLSRVRDCQAKHDIQVGYFASEIEAAWEHDVEALKQDADVPDSKLNFPSQVRASPTGPPPQWLLDDEPEPEQP